MSLVDKLSVRAGLISAVIGLGLSGCDSVPASALMRGAAMGYKMGAQNSADSGDLRGAGTLGAAGNLAEFIAQGQQEQETAEAGRDQINQTVNVGASNPPRIENKPLRYIGGTIDLIYKKHNIATYDFKDENGRYPIFIGNDFVDKDGDSQISFPEEFINPGKTKFSTNEKVKIQVFKALTREQVVLKSLVKNITRNELVEESQYFILPWGYDLIVSYKSGELKPGIHHLQSLDNNDKIIAEMFFEVY